MIYQFIIHDLLTQMNNQLKTSSSNFNVSPGLKKTHSQSSCLYNKGCNKVKKKTYNKK